MGTGVPPTLLAGAFGADDTSPEDMGELPRAVPDVELSFESLRAKTEEADLTEYATKLANYQTIYEVALQTTVMVLQPTLFSFLS